MSASLLTYFLSHPFSLRKRRENIYGYVMTHTWYLVLAPKKFSHHRPKFWIDKVRTSYTKIILFLARLSFLQEHFSLQLEYEFAEYKQGKGAMLTEAAETMWIRNLPVNIRSSPSKQKFMMTFAWAFLRLQLITNLKRNEIIASHYVLVVNCWTFNHLHIWMLKQSHLVKPSP